MVPAQEKKDEQRPPVQFLSVSWDCAVKYMCFTATKESRKEDLIFGDFSGGHVSFWRFFFSLGALQTFLVTFGGDVRRLGIIR